MNKKHVLGIIISLTFVYFAFRDINLEEFIELIKEGQYVWLLPAITAMLASFG